MRDENTNMGSIVATRSGNETPLRSRLVEGHSVDVRNRLYPGGSGLAEPWKNGALCKPCSGVVSETPDHHPPYGGAHSGLLSVGFQALGTRINLWLAPEYPLDPQALNWVHRLVKAFEAKLSRFRPDSELVRLNAGAGQGPQRVSALLFTVVESALWLARRSEGLVDPTVLPCLVREGYGPGPISGRPDYRAVRLDYQSRSISLPADISLDLGGIAKGWLADHLSYHLVRLGSTLVDVGGDLRARGRDAWKVDVENPFDPDNSLHEVQLREAGIATSSILKRSWGPSKHHLIDPRTGRSAQTGLAAATVLAPTALIAEGEAKTVLLLGPQKGKEHLRTANLAGLAVDQDANVWKVGLL